MPNNALNSNTPNAVAVARTGSNTVIAYPHKDILFEKIAPVFKDRSGGYTRIVKLAAARRGDAGEQAILEWVDATGAGSTAPKAGENAAAGTQATSEGDKPAA